MNDIKGKTKSAAKGMYLTFSKIIGRIKLKTRVKQAVKNIPVKINQSCLLSVPFACVARRKSTTSPATSSPKAVNAKRTIPGPIFAVVTCPVKTGPLSFIKTNGVNTTRAVINVNGNMKYLYHFGNIIWLFGNT
jgi:hypothetical protein